MQKEQEASFLALQCEEEAEEEKAEEEEEGKNKEKDKVQDGNARRWKVKREWIWQ